LKGTIQALFQHLEAAVLPLASTPPAVAATQHELKNETQKSKSTVLAAQKWKSVPALPQFELVHVLMIQDPSSSDSHRTPNVFMSPSFLSTLFSL
jgi:hypothetical protein